MGIRRIRARQGVRGRRERSRSRRPRRLGRAGHGALRGLAEDARARSACAAHRRRRSVLETGVTAGEVVDRIKKNVGVAWRDATYRDTFKFGGPDTEVTGIATSAFCSYEVVQKASKAGCNMIIPHEDTYWNDRDDITIVSGDPLYTM